MGHSAENDVACCTCRRGTVPGGFVDGRRMPPIPNARISDEPGCPTHDQRTHGFTDPYPDGPPAWHVPPLLCKLCHVPRRSHSRVIPPGSTEDGGA